MFHSFKKMFQKKIAAVRRISLTTIVLQLQPHPTNSPKDGRSNGSSRRLSKDSTASLLTTATWEGQMLLQPECYNSNSMLFSEALNASTSFGITQSEVSNIFESGAPCRLDSQLILWPFPILGHESRAKKDTKKTWVRPLSLKWWTWTPKHEKTCELHLFDPNDLDRSVAKFLIWWTWSSRLLGPDLDDEDLMEAGARFRNEGINLKLFSRSVSAGIQACLSQRHWNENVEAAWTKTFEMLIPTMTAP